jgi:hypothetical protein
VLVLGCLFLLALVAPRTWDRLNESHAEQPSATNVVSSPSQSLVDTSGDGAALVLPAQVQTAGFLSPTDSGPDCDSSQPGSDRTNRVGLADNSTDLTGDGWQFDAAAELKTNRTASDEPKHLTTGTAETSADSNAAMVSSPAEKAAALNAAAENAAIGTERRPALPADLASAPALSSDFGNSLAEIPGPAVLELHRDVSVLGETLAGEVSHTLESLEIHAKKQSPQSLTQTRSTAAATAKPQPSETAGVAPPKEIPGSTAAVEIASRAKAPVSTALPKSAPPPLPSLGDGSFKKPTASANAKLSSVGRATATDMPSPLDAIELPPAPHAWPLPKSLLDALHALSQQNDAALRGWVADADAEISRLNALQPHEVHQAAAVLKQLRLAVEQAATLAARAGNVASAAAIHRVQYALVRRLDVWDVVCQQRQTAIAANIQTPLNRRRMELALADITTTAEQIPGATGLREHLMLDTIAELTKRDEQASADERRHVAREVLGRIAERRQSAGHSQKTEERSLAELDKQLRRWAAISADNEPAIGEDLLALVERYESDGRAVDARRLALMRAELGRSGTAADNDLGRRLDTHYRNANVRIALTADLINRLLPEQATIESPVNETILGSQVRGRSSTSTQLAVRLLPSPTSWQFAFQAMGDVESQTRSSYGPVTFMNRGTAQFCVQKRILIDAAGIHAEAAKAAVDSSSTVEGLHTEYDNIPLVRSMVRNYAMSQREQKQNEANQETDEKIRQSACSRIDASIEPRLAHVEQNFQDRILKPLDKLELKPVVETLETSAERLTVRSRLAGDDQLAAFTPRPDAPANSLASMQMHESAVNNLLDHLDLAGRTFTLPALQQYLNERLSRAPKPTPEDLPEGVEIAFAKTEPLRIHCTGGRIELAINIAEIRQGKRRWHDFEVRAAYRPDPHGLAADFQRDGSIELGGQYKGKTEVALRGIFSKVLSRDRKISLLPTSITTDPRLANLQVTQLVVEDGWIGMAIGPTGRVACKPLQSARRY